MNGLPPCCSAKRPTLSFSALINKKSGWTIQSAKITIPSCVDVRRIGLVQPPCVCLIVV